MSQALVVLQDPGTVADVEREATVLQRYGDHVLVIQSDQLSRLREIAGTQVFEGPSPMPREVGVANLSETEELGISAWNARTEIANKKRTGDGLAWDAKGFQAP